MTSAIRLEEPMLTEQLAEASAERAKMDTQPIRDKVDRVRQALDKYEQSAIERAQRRLTVVMLEAIGHVGSAVSAEHETDEARGLLDAIADLTTVLQDPADVASTPVPLAPLSYTDACAARDEAAPASTPSTPPTTLTPLHKPEREATDAEVARVNELIAEIAILDRKWAEQPRERLTHHLKAVAAEMRHLLITFPHRHPLRWTLEKLPSQLHCICRDSQVTDFIRGVGSNAMGDWESIRRHERRAMDLFDQNASRTKAKEPKSLATLGDVLAPKLATKLHIVADTPPPPSSDSTAMRWPYLREALRNKKLMLIGGKARPERTRTFEGRTGIEFEWETIDKDAPRQVESIVRRIEGGSVVACLIAEGMMSHKDYRRIEAACKATRNRSPVPFAQCDRAGGVQIDVALDALERRFASAK